MAKPSEHIIEKLDLIFDGGKLNVLPMLHDFGLEEDLYKKSLTISVTFADASDIFNKIDFDGTEQIIVKFKSPGNEFIELTFQVWKDHVTPSTDATGSKMIQVFGVTPEHYVQQKIHINQSFNGSISDFVKVVYGTFGTKSFDCDKTSGRSITIIPGMTPFESMDFLANRSFSGKYPTSWYTFYEGIGDDGTGKYYFKNVEKLIDENKKSAIKYKYAPSSTADTLLEDRQFIIDQLEVEANKDVMKKYKSGMYASQVYQIDLIYQKVIPTNFTLDEKGFKEFVHLDDAAMSLDSKKQISETLGIINTSYWQTRMSEGILFENFFGTIIPRRLFYLNSLDQVKAKIMVPGNSDLRVGKVIDLDMLEQTASTETREQEHKTSGKYLVTNIMHVCDRKQYKCIVKMVKESYRANTRKPDKNFLA